MAELTPMMQQYLAAKEQNPDCLLFFRLGDFYEMFNDDARVAAKELDLTLTTRDRDKSKPMEDKVPMCGVPYHSSEGYIARLVARGYKVAICEQMEDPALAKGLVKREIVRVVTPGSVTESSMLEESRNNYYACVWEEDGAYGLAYCDVSTGQLSATGFPGPGAEEKLRCELGSIAPAEILLGGGAKQPQLRDFLSERLHACVNLADDALLAPERCTDAVCAQLGDPAASGLREDPAALRACGALLLTLRDIQKNELPQIRVLDYYLAGKYMALDLAARRNLELTQTVRSGDKRGSLLWVMDQTKTAMGGRLLRSWMERPLLSPAHITRRLNATQELVKNTPVREELILALRGVTDFERAMTRVSTATASCRDLVSLSQGAQALPEILAQLERCTAPYLCELRAQLDTLEDLRTRIDRTLVDEPPLLVREGGLIRQGANEEVDRLREIQSGGKKMLAEIEAREKEKTGIRNLRVGYNRVFGYYIEVAKSQTGLVPDSYIRRQTLSTGERYITQELKELESEILTAKDRLAALEYALFQELREFAAAQAARVQRTAQAVAQVDVLCSFAALAVRGNYCKPELDLSGEIHITAGRHPVVEQMRKEALFVPNDTELGTAACRAAIITGPNMAGKSTYMRQVALIVLMAQMGSFVPASAARIGIVDKLFTRIGASDDLSAGQSTFMVEMTEVADILKNATPRSLLILDEIGRGTSTFDGMAIARAVLEYAADGKRLGAKTLFATHYHELTDLTNTLPGVKNYNIAVKKRQGEMIFLRKIVPGAADDSYGIEVAKLAGLPDKLIARARQILGELEAGAPQAAPGARTQEDQPQLSLLDLRSDELRQALEEMNVETMTPIEALNALYRLRQML